MWSGTSQNTESSPCDRNNRLTYLEMIIWPREHFLTSLTRMNAFLSFIFVFQMGVCECRDGRSAGAKGKHLMGNTSSEPRGPV